MRTTILTVAGALLMLSGCWPSDPSLAQRPKTYPVSGLITLEGNPLEDAVVIFVGEGGSTARGTTNEDGQFFLTTFNQNDGAVAGPQKVSVVKEIAGYDPNELKIGEAPPASKATTHSLPSNYADPKTSGLEATVNDSGENNFTFDLQEKSK